MEKCYKDKNKDCDENCEAYVSEGLPVKSGSEKKGSTHCLRLYHENCLNLEKALTEGISEGLGEGISEERREGTRIIKDSDWNARRDDGDPFW